MTLWHLESHLKVKIRAPLSLKYSGNSLFWCSRCRKIYEIRNMGIFVIPRVYLISNYGSQTQAFFFVFHRFFDTVCYQSKIQFSRNFKDSMWFEFFNNLDLNGIKRSIIIRAKSFFIKFTYTMYVNASQSNIRSLHM